jgi:hypothetical protein
MVKFTDGPAAGVVLALKRAPLLLRVVRDPSKRPAKGRSPWDALDQLADTPQAGETIHAYRRIGKATRCHLLVSPRSASGWFAVAEYAAVEPQPDQATMTETATWRAWCLANQRYGLVR